MVQVAVGRSGLESASAPKREKYQEKLHNKFNLCKATTKAEIYKFLNLVTTAYGLKCVPELLRLV